MVEKRLSEFGFVLAPQLLDRFQGQGEGPDRTSSDWLPQPSIDCPFDIPNQLHEQHSTILCGRIGEDHAIVPLARHHAFHLCCVMHNSPGSDA
jgi:hypothetical protein